ncbi:MAG: dTDP-glucose 4,6-dehydratase [Chloroflexota bacterium]|nr:dTDP-glucose 4,6-dehydratase [Chloroflexota bacterium]
MRLLVTGGAGFIGSTFVHRRLATTDDTITVLDKLTYAGDRSNLTLGADQALPGDRLRLVVGDVADRAAVDPLVEAADGVLNFAAESHVDRSILDPDAFVRTNVLGVNVLLDAVRRHGPEQGRALRFLQVSTDEVYGSVEEGLSSEDAAMEPRSPYAAAKAAADLLVAAYGTTFGLDAVTTRGANTYGPRQHPEKLVPLFISNAMDHQPLPLYGDGLQRRDWLFVDDHADAVSFVFDHGLSGLVYNVPGGQERTNRAVTETILERLERPWSLVRQVADRLGHDRRYAISGARLESLGWRPTVSFEDGMARTIDWYERNQDWWRERKGADWNDYYARQYEQRLAGSTPA